ncbi:MAG: hypothetical protein IJ702_05585, partial [Fretibacterium sp.]|nr:hypothetical protein [Fretibacterium sp.]
VNPLIADLQPLGYGFYGFPRFDRSPSQSITIGSQPYILRYFRKRYMRAWDSSRNDVPALAEKVRLILEEDEGEAAQ